MFQFFSSDLVSLKYHLGVFGGIVTSLMCRMSPIKRHSSFNFGSILGLIALLKMKIMAS